MPTESQRREVRSWKEQITAAGRQREQLTHTHTHTHTHNPHIEMKDREVMLLLSQSYSKTMSLVISLEPFSMDLATRKSSEGEEHLCSCPFPSSHSTETSNAGAQWGDTLTLPHFHRRAFCQDLVLQCRSSIRCQWPKPTFDR